MTTRAIASTGRRRTTWTAGLLVASIVLAACGSNDEPSDAASTPSGSSTNTAAPSGEASLTLAEVKANVARLKQPSNIELDLPDTPVAPKAGTRVAIILSGATGGQILDSLVGIEEAIKAAGWTSKVFDGKFTPTVQAGVINEAVQQGYTAILMNSVDPANVSSAIAGAIAKDIPVVCHSCYAQYPGVTDVTFGPVETGQAIADWSVANAEGKGKIAVLNAEEFSLVRAFAAETEKRIRATCPDCEIVKDKFSIAQALAPGSPWFASFLAEHPPGDLTSILAGFDAAAVGFATTAEQLGRSDVKLAGNAHVAAFNALMAKPNPIAVASTALPLDYIGWISVDSLIRRLAGEEPFKADNIPVSLVTPDNLDLYDAKKPQLIPTVDYRSTFKALWGKS